MKHRLTPRAAQEATDANAWWREHRPTAPALFATELAAALATIHIAPLSGAPYGSHEELLVRRVLLPKTRFHAYYVVDDVGPLVLSVWSAQRGRGPNFGPTH